MQINANEEYFLFKAAAALAELVIRTSRTMSSWFTAHKEPEYLQRVPQSLIFPAEQQYLFNDK